MPSKEDICAVQETLPSSKKDFLTADVEELVAAITHNLKLKSKPLSSVCRKHRRMSPYPAPVRTVSRRKTDDKENTIEHSTRCKYCILTSKSPMRGSPNDPYEMLQEMIRGGYLIKEAVKRLTLATDRTPKCLYEYEYDVQESDTESIDVEN